MPIAVILVKRLIKESCKSEYDINFVETLLSFSEKRQFWLSLYCKQFRASPSILGDAIIEELSKLSDLGRENYLKYTEIITKLKIKKERKKERETEKN